MTAVYELYLVKVEHPDAIAEKEWEKRNNDGEVPPDLIVSERYVVTNLADPTEAVRTACEVALLATVGSRDRWERCEPAVLSVERITETCILGPEVP